MSGRVFHRRLAHEYPVVEWGEGVYLYDTAGRQYLDAAGGALVVNVGHGVTEIVDTLAAQARRVAFAHGTQFSSDALEDYARPWTLSLPSLIRGSIWYLVVLRPWRPRSNWPGKHASPAGSQADPSSSPAGEAIMVQLWAPYRLRAVRLCEPPMRPCCSTWPTFLPLTATGVHFIALTRAVEWPALGHWKPKSCVKDRRR